MGLSTGSLPDLLRGCCHPFSHYLFGPGCSEIGYCSPFGENLLCGIGFGDATGNRFDLLIPLSTSFGAEHVSDTEADDQSCL